MRAFDIICVVVLTKLLLLTSNVSSTPTEYSTSNPHLLTSGNTHDDIRALRVSDESKTQERGLSFNFDSLLKYIPWTAARAEKYIQTKITILDNNVGKWLDSLLTNENFKWEQFAVLLNKNVKPKYIKRILWKYGKSKDEIESILLLYTTLYKHFGHKSTRKIKDVNMTKITALKVRTAEADIIEKQLRARKYVFQNVDTWIQTLQMEDEWKWYYFESMVYWEVHPSDIRKILWRHGVDKDEIDSILVSYTKLYQKRPSNHAKDIKGIITKDAEEIRAAEASIAENHVLTKMGMSRDKINDWVQMLRVNREAKYEQFKKLLSHDINPNDVRKMSWKNEWSAYTTELVIVSYTNLFKRYKAEPFKNKTPLEAVNKVTEEAKKEWEEIDKFVMTLEVEKGRSVTSLLKNAKNNRLRLNSVQVDDKRMGEILRFYGMSEDEVTTILKWNEQFRSKSAVESIVKSGRSV